MLMSLGRLYVSSSRCEWYIGEIISESGLGDGHGMKWARGTEFLRSKAPEISIIMGSDIAECITESTRCSELLRDPRIPR